MELHRSRGSLVAAAFFLIGGILVLTCRAPHTVIGWIAWGLVGGGSVLLGLYALAVSLRRFRFVIGPTGLDVDTEHVKRELSWTEVSRLSLETVKPSPSAQNPHPILFATLSTSDPGAERVKLLDLTEVREAPDEVAAALAAHAGGRFVDERGLRTAPETDFTVVLRGYDRQLVDTLVRQSRQAEFEGDRVRAVRAIDEFLAAPVVVARGYEREQVNAYLAQVRAALAA